MNEKQNLFSSENIINVGKCATTGVDISICYTTFGDIKNPCILLIMGLNAVGAFWRDKFCELLANSGYYIIRYDNRDVGLSTHLTDFPSPHILRMALPHILSIGEQIPYTLHDMAQDGINLLIQLGIHKAHIFGCSMGGMIAQIMAIKYPTYIQSLTILFSHAGNKDRKRESWSTKLWLLEKPVSSSIEDIVDLKLKAFKRLAGPFYQPDEVKYRQLVKLILTRAPDDPMGLRRQLAATHRAESRVEALKELKIPTLIIHGMMDPLIPYENSVYMAELIGHSAKLVLFPLMGHTIPEELYNEIVQEVVWNAQRASSSVIEEN